MNLVFIDIKYHMCLWVFCSIFSFFPGKSILFQDFISKENEDNDDDENGKQKSMNGFLSNGVNEDENEQK